MPDLALNSRVLKDALQVGKCVLNQRPIVHLEILLVQFLGMVGHLPLLLECRQVIQPLRDVLE